MRDPRYWYSAGGFQYRRDAVDYIGLGLAAATSPLWGPFWLLGKAAVGLLAVIYDATHTKEARR